MFSCGACDCFAWVLTCEWVWFLGLEGISTDIQGNGMDIQGSMTDIQGVESDIQGLKRISR